MSAPQQPSACSAKLWLQTACVFAGAVAVGLVYNSASPLGLRNEAPVSTDKPADEVIPQEGYFNETLSLKLETSAAPAPQVRPTALAPGAAAATIPSLTWPQVQALMKTKKIVLVDARTKSAYDLGHIPGAVLLPGDAPVPEMQAFTARYPKDTALVLYCGSTTCRASERLARLLVGAHGFTDVSEMPGGYAEYTMAQASQPKAKP